MRQIYAKPRPRLAISVMAASQKPSIRRVRENTVWAHEFPRPKRGQLHSMAVRCGASAWLALPPRMTTCKCGGNRAPLMHFGQFNIINENHM